MQGRRRPDATWPGVLPPDDLDEGDYWRVLAHPQWGDCWWICAPEVHGAAGIPNHHVEEHEDGTISVLPQPGNSNSILASKGPGREWHGYIRRGVWEKA